MSLFDFDEKITTPLCEIMTRNGSDKGEHNQHNWQHNYTTFYYNILKDIKNNNLRFFELGLGTTNQSFASNMAWRSFSGLPYKHGASLYGWSEFLPNSSIFGCDIDKDILFNTDRIKTFFCDQTNPQIIKQMWDNNPELEEKFDIIIDDGYHNFDANICFFENSIQKLKTGGYYIIEDLLTSLLDLYENKIKEWELTYTNMTFNIISYKKLSDNQVFNNNLLVVYKIK
jgi:SAM-dependent methyltransferase